MQARSSLCLLLACNHMFLDCNCLPLACTACPIACPYCPLHALLALGILLCANMHGVALYPIKGFLTLFLLYAPCVQIWCCSLSHQRFSDLIPLVCPFPHGYTCKIFSISLACTCYLSAPCLHSFPLHALVCNCMSLCMQVFAPCLHCLYHVCTECLPLVRTTCPLHASVCPLPAQPTPCLQVSTLCLHCLVPCMLCLPLVPNCMPLSCMSLPIAFIACPLCATACPLHVSVCPMPSLFVSCLH